MKPGWAVTALVGFLLVGCFSDAAAATNHSVGGAFGWDLSSDLQEWASQATFHVGDSLVFTSKQFHEVLEVNKEDYDMCHTENPLEIGKDDGGTVVIPLMEEGDRFFICGRLGHCAMGLKLHVRVLPQLMSDSNATSSSPGPRASPTASGSDKGSSPPVASLLQTFGLVCLGLATIGTIVPPLLSSVSILINGMEHSQHHFWEYVVALLTSTLWLRYDIVQGHFWLILAFKILTIVVEIGSLTIFLLHVQPSDWKKYCAYVVLFNISIPLHLLLTTSVTISGSSALLSNVVVYIWPVHTMIRVVRDKKCTTDDIWVGKSLICLATGLLWILYASVMGDKYITIPNLVQVCVATAQLVLVKIYGEGTSSLLQEPLIGAEA